MHQRQAWGSRELGSKEENHHNIVNNNEKEREQPTGKTFMSQTIFLSVCQINLAIKPLSALLAILSHVQQF